MKERMNIKFHLYDVIILKRKRPRQASRVSNEKTWHTPSVEYVEMLSS